MRLLPGRTAAALRPPSRRFAVQLPGELEPAAPRSHAEPSTASAATNVLDAFHLARGPLSSSQTIGAKENARYACLDSVKAWRSHDADAAAARIGHALRKDPSALSYFGYHGFRAGAFAGQAALTLLLATAASNLSRSRGFQASDFMGIFSTSVTGSMRDFRHHIAGTLADDFANVQAGVYKAPWDMSLRHRQMSPPRVLRSSVAFLQESLGTLRSLSASAAGKHVDTKNWLKSPLHPDYCSDSFHFQGDGWLSTRSADVYEMSTETLFLGIQDAMQRAALVPIQRWRSRGKRGGVRGTDLRVAEFACGTGRFSTFVRDNMPAADFTLLDLSPFYLEKARENHQYFETYMGKDKVTGEVDFVLAQAEHSGLPSSTFDVVHSMYAFHELPVMARAAVAKEMVRVAKPGGIIVLTDSTQHGDRPETDGVSGKFGAFNEPYFQSYLVDDLGAYFEAAGASPHEKTVCSVTKSLSFIKRG